MDASTSNRRAFLRWLGAAAVLGSVAPESLAAGLKSPTKLTILHTNDVHSRLDPFPMDGSRNAGKAGVARRATLLSQIRQQEANTLLFDAGDLFQGTPYFNLYKGEPEVLVMNKLGYDAATIGNHDFDGGIDNMRTQFGKATFPFLVANYDFKNTVMDGRTQLYKVFVKDGIRIGVFGVGIKPDGLIPPELYKEMTYLDPVELATDVARQLREGETCDYVICLSHLGYQYNDQTVSDRTLVPQTNNIDLVIGGHTHTFLDAPVTVNNRDGKPVLINQVGFAGINLGRIDLTFESGKAGASAVGKPIEVK